MNLLIVNGIMKACCDRESAGDRLNSRCSHNIQLEAMFDDK
jgi:hypothetical protein